MTSGIPLSFAQKEYIVAHKDDKFVNQIAGELGVSRGAVKRVINDQNVL